MIPSEHPNLRCRRKGCFGKLTLLGNDVFVCSKTLDEARTRGAECAKKYPETFRHGSYLSCDVCGDIPEVHNNKKGGKWQRFCLICCDVYVTGSFHSKHGETITHLNSGKRSSPIQFRTTKHMKSLLHFQQYSDILRNHEPQMDAELQWLGNKNREIDEQSAHISKEEKFSSPKGLNLSFNSEMTAGTFGTGRSSSHDVRKILSHDVRSVSYSLDSRPKAKSSTVGINGSAIDRQRSVSDLTVNSSAKIVGMLYAPFQGQTDFLREPHVSEYHSSGDFELAARRAQVRRDRYRDPSLYDSAGGRSPLQSRALNKSLELTPFERQTIILNGGVPPTSTMSLADDLQLHIHGDLPARMSPNAAPASRTNHFVQSGKRTLSNISVESNGDSRRHPGFRANARDQNLAGEESFDSIVTRMSTLSTEGEVPKMERQGSADTITKLLIEDNDTKGNVRLTRQGSTDTITRLLMEEDSAVQRRPTTGETDNSFDCLSLGDAYSRPGSRASRPMSGRSMNSLEGEMLSPRSFDLAASSSNEDEFVKVARRIAERSSLSSTGVDEPYVDELMRLQRAL